MKYNVGDVIKIRRDLTGGELYGGWCVVDYMLDFAGHEATIVYVDDDHYLLENIDCRWTDAMFSGLAEPKYFEAEFETSDDFGFLYGGRYEV